MVSVCFYFQVHQPYRIRNYSVFEIGKNHNYFNDLKNAEVLKKVAEKCYKPANKTILKLINKLNGKFKVAYSLTGPIIEQLEAYAPEVLDSFKELVDTGCVELLDETYYHSLSFLYSKKEFQEQVMIHRRKMKELFDFTPKVFRNTELIYNNELASMVGEMGYKGILAEGASNILGWKSPNYIYKAKGSSIKLLLKNYHLSDDIAFRFSEKSWREYPLTADKFSEWINAVNGNGFVVNLFMDYETFGEHHWEDTGIFNFLEHFPKEFLDRSYNDFVTPSEAVERYRAMDELDIPFAVSWADIERDLSAWLGNDMQRDAIKKLYELEEDVLSSEDNKLISDWRKLQISDHFYYMCTKWFADGDVHKYFNPFDSPYDAFISFMNILNDIKIRIKEVKEMAKVDSNSLANVPEDKKFWVCDGRVLRNRFELAAALKNMNTGTYGYHANKNKNDFAKWVNDIMGDKKLADALLKAKNSALAAREVEIRINELKKK